MAKRTERLHRVIVWRRHPRRQMAKRAERLHRVVVWRRCPRRDGHGQQFHVLIGLLRLFALRVRCARQTVFIKLHFKLRRR